jgi:hypothetical protein
VHLNELVKWGEKRLITEANDNKKRGSNDFFLGRLQEFV